jgi:hypothetical protein
MADPLDKLIADKRAEVEDLKQRIAALTSELSILELASSLRPPAAPVTPAPAAPPPAAAPPSDPTGSVPGGDIGNGGSGDAGQARKGRLFG